MMNFKNTIINFGFEDEEDEDVVIMILNWQNSGAPALMVLHYNSYGNLFVIECFEYSCKTFYSSKSFNIHKKSKSKFSTMFQNFS